MSRVLNKSHLSASLYPVLLRDCKAPWRINQCSVLAAAPIGDLLIRPFIGPIDCRTICACSDKKPTVCVLSDRHAKRRSPFSMKDSHWPFEIRWGFRCPCSAKREMHFNRATSASAFEWSVRVHTAHHALSDRGLQRYFYSFRRAQSSLVRAANSLIPPRPSWISAITSTSSREIRLRALILWRYIVYNYIELVVICHSKIVCRWQMMGRGRIINILYYWKQTNMAIYLNTNPGNGYVFYSRKEQCFTTDLGCFINSCHPKITTIMHKQVF